MMIVMSVAFGENKQGVPQALNQWPVGKDCCFRVPVVPDEEDKDESINVVGMMVLPQSDKPTKDIPSCHTVPVKPDAQLRSNGADSNECFQLGMVEIFLMKHSDETFSQLSLEGNYLLRRNAITPMILGGQPSFVVIKNELPIVCNICQPPLVSDICARICDIPHVSQI